MQSVFVSYAFRADQRDYVDAIDRVLASHFLRKEQGWRLGGQLVTPEVTKRIIASDALIALATARDETVDGRTLTHPWVANEIAIARAQNRRCIVLLQLGVQPPAGQDGYETLPLDPAAPLPAFIALAETIGLWKEEAGRTLKVQVLPEDLAQDLGDGNGAYNVQYRLIRGAEVGEWVRVTPIPEPGGTFLYLNGVRDDHAIQLSVDGRARWASRPRSQWLEVRLEKRA